MLRLSIPTRVLARVRQEQRPLMLTAVLLGLSVVTVWGVGSLSTF